MKRIAFICSLLVLLSAYFALAQINVGDSGTIKGTVFGDFYWIPLNHNSDLEGNNGFWFRRIRFTYDRDLSESFSSRFRLDMSSEGDFLTNSSIVPSVKDAYLKWANDAHAVYAGITSVPTWGVIEDVWGYRSVEKTPLDLQGFGSSRDFGIKIQGKIGDEEKVGYNFMLGNGNSNRNELNQGKKFMLAVNYQLTDHWIVEGYGDFNGQPNNQNIYTAQGFLGYQSDALNFGALYAYQFRNNTLVAGDLNLNLASIFANLQVSNKVTSFLRVDHMFDPNPRGEGIDYIPFSDQAESTLIIAGADILLEDNIHLIPNFESVFYGESALGNTPDTDLIPRITLYYNF
jgi:hypothetical protein